ncbi:ThuA domain-containing protein [Actinoplanes sp. NPDC048988]|uniref:ThuA domain-containing protein n=1 Tax=Actinoplanes sp. NPDC048988 TaxID=3363901 RepID=UPI0037220BA0
MTRALVFTRTAGYRHESLPAAVAAVSAFPGVRVVPSEDPVALHDLSRFDVVMFLSTTGDVLDRRGRSSLRSFVTGGGGFVGVHSAAGTELSDPWYGELLGARFAGHPDGVQQATLFDPDGVPWKFTDEWYGFTEVRDDLEILLTVDEETYEPGPYAMTGPHPQAWRRPVEAGRSWYTALGHTNEAWADPAFLDHVRGGIAYAARG